ncbi:MAG TPA: MATE family efflux transporter [Vicinamibacterales bacterium]|nr:MATE family efflux transporter [Vicinamibacterales bacterium]
MSASAPPQENPSLWSTVKEAIRGSRQDYTEAPIGRAVVLLAVPMVLEMLMESIFVVADVFFVGRLGPDAVATVGITESLMTVMYALAIGLSIGAAATVARRVGEKDYESAARSAVQSVLMGVVAAAIFGTIGVLFGPQLLRLMGASDEVLRTGSTFAQVMLGGSGTVVLLFLINAVFRGAGDAAIAMRVLWFANAINIVLGPCLIFGIGPFPEMGVTGAAIGTTIGRGSGVVYQLIHLARHDGRIRVRRSHLGLNLDLMRGILRLSGTATFQNFIGTASWMALVRILTDFGSAAVAGNTIGIRIILFALLPSFGVSNAAATLVGQNLGAGKPDRAEAAAWKAGMYNTICLGTVGAIFLLFAPQLIALFTTDPEVARYGVRCLRIVAAGFLFYGYAMVLTASFNGAGDTRTPTLINLVCLWLWEIPLAWALAHPLGFGPTGVFIAVSVAFSTMALISGWLFSKGMWKTKRV